MKTMTEFSAFPLREAYLKNKEIHAALKGEGKPEAELAQAQKDTFSEFLKEKHKIEGEKLDLFLKALELISSKPGELENLRRVVVYTVAEGEKVPHSVTQKDGHAFGAEYLASLRPKKQDRREAGSKFSKDQGKGKGRGKRSDDLRGKRPDGQAERRGANGRQNEQTAGEGAPRSAEGRRDRGRGPRRDGENRPTSSIRTTSGEVLAPGHIPVEKAAGALREPRQPRGPREPRQPREARAPREPRQPRVIDPAKLPSKERLPVIQPKVPVNPEVLSAAAAERAVHSATATPAVAESSST